MISKKLKILFIIEQCNPEWASVPLVGFNFYNSIRDLVDTHLVTHERNRSALQKVSQDYKIDYIKESSSIKYYYMLIKKMTSFIKGTNWPLLHTLFYPVYAGFNREVYKRYASKVLAFEYDIVHAMTPMIPRYPVKIIEACKTTPFILGPVNGGIPFPAGFHDTAKKEYANFNFLRGFSKYIPGYARTYKNADMVLSGSTYTLNMLNELFYPSKLNIELFFENGVKKEFLCAPEKSNKEIIKLLFVGRLVPYKGADMVIEALAKVIETIKSKVHLTIVGDGPEKSTLEKQAKDLKISDIIDFTGWVSQDDISKYYKCSDIFCFPSIREFGGAVVLEAMAYGIPSIVIDHGGIGEYMTEETGFKIQPLSREHIIKEIIEKICLLADDNELRFKFAQNAFKRGELFEWKNKAEALLDIYQRILENKKS
jgi:glycosyltransferase involved in cell wall biosynthesis